MSATVKQNAMCLMSNPTRKYYEPINCLHEDAVPTPRQHPYDLVDICSTLIRKALGTETVDVGMVTAFGDAFIHYDKSARKPPYFVFADEPADDLPEFAYNIKRLAPKLSTLKCPRPAT